MTKWFKAVAVALALPALLAVVILVRLKYDPPDRPVVDASTLAFIASASNVETFRLWDTEEMEQPTQEESEADSKRAIMLGDYLVHSEGPTEGTSFARRLSSALSKDRQDKHISIYSKTSCFAPGVGYRVWHGKDYLTMVVCFHCGGFEIDGSRNGHKIQQIRGSLGDSRTDLLRLSQSAFPKDTVLGSIKPGNG